jgi:hypothetical protein
MMNWIPLRAEVDVFISVFSEWQACDSIERF